MLSCEDAERLIARYADSALNGAARASMDAHVESCSACRAAVAEQRSVAALLNGREPVSSRDLAPAVRARIEMESSIFGLADWRAWTMGLVPVAAALALAAYLGIGASSPVSSQQSVLTEDGTSASSTPVLLQPGSSGDALVEAVLTGEAASSQEQRDVR